MEREFWKPVPPGHLIAARAGKPVLLEPFPEVAPPRRGVTPARLGLPPRPGSHIVARQSAARARRGMSAT